ncbi:hematopoietic progenitor cell antigen CD34-like [Gymnodraco acuticeps]|uniref:Hematopoietic progenitor cell antigen CD34-like n=1 Tax=Gymnodraco acuticeps TaxID=8218 RepID=A0A6P8T0F6_GYMAC|nr:hematopoietic progenitor cell antigen CD34-like [Gymnodraco acuticeps]
MAASSVQKTNGPLKMLPFALLLIASFLNGGVTAQDPEVVTGTVAPVFALELARGDGDTMTSEATESGGPQIQVFPSLSPVSEATTPAAATLAATPEAIDSNDSSHVDTEKSTDDTPEFTVEEHTEMPKTEEPETPAHVPARGDGPDNVPQPVLKEDVVCVSKEAVEDKNSVSLKLKASSNCEDTKKKIESVLQELCGEDCKLEIYQEDNTDEIIVSGKYVEDDVAGMAEKFNNDNIKDMTDVEEASPRWGKSSKLVLVSLLLAGLLLAALLVAGYYLKTHRKNSKGVRLADTFQVDEENQANTLVSVAPLPQEPVDKPTTNGESPPENGTNPGPTTNGHSATQSPVADTEM